jgi:molecular chaperone GrpE
LNKKNEEYIRKLQDFRTKLAESVEECELIQKRSATEKEALKVFAIQKFAKDLLEVVDNLGRSLQALPLMLV